MNIARSELILGGQKSGKSRRAEALAAQWLQQGADHQALLLATASAHDEEMRARIARHQADRRARVPQLMTVHAPRNLARALQRYGDARTLVVVDCLTVWLTNWLMPLTGKEEQKPAQTQDWSAQKALFFEVLEHSPGPIVLVGNEIGLGVIPMGREVREFVDALGLLNQRAAAACARVTLMAAGLPLTLKGQP
ncbi:bifunctional adenosylcobinamide kinase/adenosylcobinamide-phosphate guanylyltransferase [Comamonas sp. NLF-1-9]|uniref:bifunctional adenosylcobinamide kinase/adenosylcobinamide-phosphate guanylyltransferase n=1 Tax=Comamonas sp. NLF-1-9 TaxID=2853163 RepID=UPI001C47B523|nr:bifunctional adenosylcobinamide kinase/adenosylcobinamide-phosphate guanylyltransferase [Comamonas sp. NLF-1-9]QXL83184.1 bifunctional adenosylcobinamide kinase/adenosylcobinamide-phosphate guanylyltransferase [Comamonas sp. NLF-1-9]